MITKIVIFFSLKSFGSGFTQIESHPHNFSTSIFLSSRKFVLYRKGILSHVDCILTLVLQTWPRPDYRNYLLCEYPGVNPAPTYDDVVLVFDEKMIQLSEVETIKCKILSCVERDQTNGVLKIHWCFKLFSLN